MKLLSFKIENYRSILNTECHLSQDITVLAGKNEAGKTTILSALQCFNSNVKATSFDNPLNFDADYPPEATITLEINEQEKEKILKEFKLDFKKFKNNTVIINFNLAERKYGISGSFYDDVIKNLLKLTSDEKININGMIDEINNLINERQISLVSIIHVDDDNIEIISDSLDAHLDSLPRNPENNQQNYPDLYSKINELKSIVQTILKRDDLLLRLIWDNRPKFVMFSSFDDLLPASVDYGEFINENTLKEKHEIIHDLITLANLDVNKLQTEDRQVRENLTAKASTITTTKFQKFWNQNPVEFKFSIDQPLVSIFIKDKGREELYKPEQRSKGFQWYLSFYLRLESQANEKNTIVLIDEPGLYLHPKAQHDVLNVLEDLSKTNQIIYTTHSPYLIDPDNLNRVRLVVKDQKTNQTTITRSFHSGGDADTITPIITAIGLDISRGLLFSKKLNVVMEGVSDYYYLRGMIEFLRKQKKYNFPSDVSLIPCMGHTTIGLITSLLTGLELNFKVLFDNKGTVKTINKLKNDLANENQIITIGINENDSIEDLFSDEDKKTYQIINQNKSKVLISRDFYEKIMSNDYKSFTDKTISNFTEILKKLSK